MLKDLYKKSLHLYPLYAGTPEEEHYNIPQRALDDAVKQWRKSNEALAVYGRTRTLWEPTDSPATDTFYTTRNGHRVNTRTLMEYAESRTTRPDSYLFYKMFLGL